MNDEINYELSDIDKMGMRKTVKLFIFYQLQPTVSQDKLITSVIEGVKHATSQLPFMAGCLQVQDSGKVCIVTTPENQLEIKTLRFRSAEYKSFSTLAASGFHPSDLNPSQLLPEAPKHKTPVCMLQLNFIEGGLILGFSMNHAVGDWKSIDTFLSLVCQSSKAYDEGLAMPKYTADLNRAPYSASSSDLDSDLELSRKELEEKLPSFKIAEVSALSFNPQRASKSGIYKILYRSIQQLKAECTPFLSGADYISSYDCISALVWAVVTRARLSLHPEKSTSPSRLVHPIDVRTRDPEGKSSERYFGNAAIAAQAGPLTAAAIVSDGARGLALAASSIRRSICSVDMSSIGYMIALMNSVSPSEMMVPRADFADMDLLMNSWYSGAAENYDLGAAVSVAVRPLVLMAGASMILPNFSRGETRGYEVFLELAVDEHELLRRDEEFLKYFEVVAWK